MKEWTVDDLYEWVDELVLDRPASTQRFLRLGAQVFGESELYVMARWGDSTLSVLTGVAVPSLPWGSMR